MKTYLTFLLIFCTNHAIGQSTFFKRISLNDRAQGGDQLMLINDSILIQGYYFNDFYAFGSLFLKMDKSGNIGKSTFIDDIQPSDRSLLKTDQGLLLAGNYNHAPNKQKLYWLDNDLNIQKSTLLHDSLSNYEVSFQVGLTEFENRYHISTSANKNNKRTLFDFIVNKEGTVNSLLVLPIKDPKTYREAFVNKKDEITYYYNRNSEGLGDENGIVTYKDGTFKNLWNTGNYISSRHVPRGLQLYDSSYIIVNINDLNSQLSTISKLDQEGKMLWTSSWPQKSTRFHEVRKIIECKNGDIIGIGLISEYDLIPRVESCAWIFRMNKEGKLLWERAYYELEDGNATQGLMSDLKELEDGSFIGTGQISSKETFIDILLLRIDSFGCIEGLNCDKTVVSTKTAEQIPKMNDIVLYPNPVLDDHVILDVKSNVIKTALFYDIEGQLIKEVSLRQGKNKVPLDTTSSIIIVKMLNEKGSAVHIKKLVRI